MTRGLRVVLALVVVLALGVPQALAVTDEEVEEARQDLIEARQEADRVAQRIEEAWARQYQLEEQAERIADQRDTARARVRSAADDLEEAAIRLYMDAASGESLSMMMIAPPDDFAAAIQYLTTSASDGEDAIDRYTAAEAELERVGEDLDRTLAEQQETAAELEALAAEVRVSLQEAQERYDRLVRIQAEEEAARLAAAAAAATSTTTTTAAPTTAAPTTTTAATDTTAGGETTTTTAAETTTTTAPPETTTTTTAPSSGGGGACPVQGAVSFVDSWGAPRSGGRTHKGVDMMAERGTPIVAIYSGVVERLSNSTLGGISVYLRSDAGDRYYYAHLDGWAEGISGGVRVEEGQLLGYNGSTGNAPDYLPHLHFEYHPGGGAAVNPYPLVKSICG